MIATLLTDYTLLENIVYDKFNFNTLIFILVFP
jgi:hypothetical protein